MIKIDSHSGKTETDNARRTWINGVTYIAEDATNQFFSEQWCKEAGYTVTHGQTPPEGWDAVADAFRRHDRRELARLAVAALS